MFESIRDGEGNVICYHITLVGTIEDDGKVELKTGFGDDGDNEMAFGKVTLYNCSRRIGVLLKETGSRVYHYDEDTLNGAVDVVSFAARGKHAADVASFEVGNRVLLTGRAYIRKNKDETVERKPELSLTVTGSFLLGGKRRPPRRDLIPQSKDDLYVPKEEEVETYEEENTSSNEFDLIFDESIPDMSLPEE